MRRGAIGALLGVLAACGSEAPPVIDAGKSSFYVTPEMQTVGDTVSVMITVRGPDGLSIPDVEVELVASGGDNQIVQPEPTDRWGRTTATWTSTSAEDKTLTALVGTASLGERVVSFVAGPPAQLRFAQQPGTPLAGGRFAAHIALDDEFGNPTDATSPLVSVELVEPPSSATLVGTLARSPIDGVAQFKDLQINAAGSGYVLRATAPGLTGVDSAPFAVEYGPPETSTLALSPLSVAADGAASVTITVLARNRYGVVMVGQSVQLSASGTGNTITPSTGLTGSAGTFIATMTSTTAAYKTITATVGNVTLTKVAAFTRPPCSLHLPGPRRAFGVPSRAGFAVGDLDGDGHVDSVETSNSGMPAIYIRRGTADGWEPWPSYVPLSPTLTWVTTADVNGDAHLDVVVAAGDANQALVLLGTGAGVALDPPIAVQLAARASSLALADFNADGKLDLAASLPTVNRIDVHLGVGDGTFGGAATTLATGSGASSLMTGDLNNDGRPDVLVQNTTDATMSAFLATGNATFGGAISTADTGTPALADVDADGVLDALLVSSTGSLRVRLGNGAGSFALSQTVSSGISDAALAVADFDGDLDKDVVLAGTPSLALLAGAGNGTFTLVGTYVSDAVRVAAAGGGAVAVDVDADGWMDVVDAGLTVGAVRNLGSGRFALPILAAPERVVLEQTADFNGDGRPDLFGHHGATSAAATLLGTASGALTRVGLATTVGDGARGAIADVNEDGRADVVLFDGGLRALLGGGTGSFTAGPSSTIDPFSNAVLADLDSDGHVDLVMIGDPTHGLSVALGTGQGTFGTPAKYFMTSLPIAIAIADVDQDGDVDPIVATQTRILVYRNTGNGTLAANPDVYAPGYDPSISAIAVADFDFDGDPDIACAGKLYAMDTSASIRVLKGSATGVFTVPDVQLFPGTTQVFGIQVADVDATATQDLVMDTAHGIIVLQGNGDATFAEPRMLAIGGSTGITPGSPFALADLDNDSRVDLAFSTAQGIAIAYQGACTP